MLNLSANNKTPFSDEEMAYATCWLQEVKQFLIRKSQSSEEKGEKQKAHKQDPLETLTSPYNPNVALMKTAAVSGTELKNAETRAGAR